MSTISTKICDACRQEIDYEETPAVAVIVVTMSSSVDRTDQDFHYTCWKYMQEYAAKKVRTP